MPPMLRLAAALALMLLLPATAQTPVDSGATVTVTVNPQTADVRAGDTANATVDVRLELRNLLCTGAGQTSVALDVDGTIPGVDATLNASTLQFSGFQQGLVQTYTDTQSTTLAVVLGAAAPLHPHMLNVSATFMGMVQGCQTINPAQAGIPDAQGFAPFTLNIQSPPAPTAPPEPSSPKKDSPSAAISLLIVGLALAVLSRRR